MTVAIMSPGLTEFGNPVTGTTAYTLCLYDGVGGARTLKMTLSVVAGGTCGKVACWKQLGSKAYRYKNPATNASGVTRLRLKSGVDGKAAVRLAAKGDNVPSPAPFSSTEMFDQNPDVTVQLLSSNGGVCFGAAFAPPAKKNTVEVFKVRF